MALLAYMRVLEQYRRYLSRFETVIYTFMLYVQDKNVI